MIGFLIASTLTFGPLKADDPFESLMKSHGYVRLSRRENPGFGRAGTRLAGFMESWRNTKRGEKLSLECWRLGSESAMNDFWSTYLGSFARLPSGSSRREGKPSFLGATHSGLPLGERLYFGVHARGSSQVQALSREVALHLITTRGPKGPSAGVGWYPGEAALFEGISRWVLAIESAKLMSPKQASVSGQVLNALQTSSGKTLVNLRQWASRNGFSYKLDPNGIVTLAKGTVKWTVPLGSPKVKKNLNWVDLSSVVVFASGDAYLSRDAIEAEPGVVQGTSTFDD